MKPAVRCSRNGSSVRGFNQTDMDMSTIDAGQAIALKSLPIFESRIAVDEKRLNVSPIDVEGDAGRQQEPRHRSAAGEQHGAADDQRQQQEVADRVGQIDRGAEGAAAGVVHDAVKGERRTDRRRTETGDHAVEPVRSREPTQARSQEWTVAT